jgi:hypothetical protein
MGVDQMTSKNRARLTEPDVTELADAFQEQIDLADGSAEAAIAAAAATINRLAEGDEEILNWAASLLD